jgi:hypothetical protein
MNKKAKNAPTKLVMIWIAFICVGAFLYNYLPNDWKSAGFVWLILSAISACNTCYRKGYEDARDDGI